MLDRRRESPYASARKHPRRACARAILAAVLLLTLASTSLAQSSDEDAILAIGPAFEAAYAAGDVEALGVMYVEDALYINSNGTIVEGPEGIAALFTAFREAEFVSLDLESMKVHVSGDMAFSAGTWTLTHVSDMTTTGYYSNAYLRTDAGWRIAHTGNSPIEEEPEGE